MFHIPCNCLPKAFVLADDNTNESGKLCCETAVASTHLCCCHQILLFQSPYTGTEQCGQVPFLMFFLFTPQMLSVFSNTFPSAQFNELWHISWLFWNVAHNHLFCQRLLWLLLVTQDMGASQSSVCQVFINISFLLCKVDHIVCFLGCKFLFVRLRQRRQGLWQGLVLVSVQAWLPPWTLSRCTILYL